MQIRTGSARVGSFTVRSGGQDENDVRDIDIFYEDRGDLDAPPILLIMGLTAQMIVWPDRFCDALVDAGFRVIRFDNRDVGLSTHLRGVRVTGSVLARLARTELGLNSDVPYTVTDMAADAVGVLDHLDIESAHVVGASMGGMIAQVVAGAYPDRVRSVAILFSSTLQMFLPPPDPRLLSAFVSGPGPNATREDHIAVAAKTLQAIAGSGYPIPDDEAWKLAAAYHDRAYDPSGAIRQVAAVTGTGSLRRYTRRITAPAVVIHGLADRLMPPAGGKAIAHAIPDSRLVLIPRMGHDVPEELWPRIIGAISDNTARAGKVAVRQT